MSFRLACPSLAALAHPRPKNWALFCIRRRPEQEKRRVYPLHTHVNPCGLAALSSLHAYLMQVPTIELIKMQPGPCLFTHREKPPAWFFASA